MDIRESMILLVDDAPELLSMVKELLAKAGYVSIDTARTCCEAEEKLRGGKFHLVLLDVMLPDGSGFELYRRMRENALLAETPVIFLSARDEDRSKLHGLGLGADDYITKPFIPEELVYRIKAVLRRTYRFTDDRQPLMLGDVEVSFASACVKKGDKVLKLTAKEYALLCKLADNRGRIVTIDALCDALWPDGSYGLESSLIVHIRRLREKIENDPSKPRYLVTVRGLGYKLEK